jgi:hypothetical protein
MKQIIFVLILLFSVLGFSNPKKYNEITYVVKHKDTLYWKGNPITKKDLEDSLRVTFFKYCDCIDSNKIKKLRFRKSSNFF